MFFTLPGGKFLNFSSLPPDYSYFRFLIVFHWNVYVGCHSAPEILNLLNNENLTQYNKCPVTGTVNHSVRHSDITKRVEAIADSGCTPDFSTAASTKLQGRNQDSAGGSGQRSQVPTSARLWKEATSNARVKTLCFHHSFRWNNSCHQLRKTVVCFKPFSFAKALL